MQKIIDRILKLLRENAKIYVNDIVIFTSFLQNHIVIFNKVLKRLISFNIYLLSTKSFINYPSVRFFEQRVDILELSTVEEKFTAIIDLVFLQILRQLKYYLGFIKYLK